MNHTTVGVNLSTLLSSLPIVANPFPCVTMPETFPMFYSDYRGMGFGDTHITTWPDGGITTITYKHNEREYRLVIDAIDYDQNAPEEYKFVPHPEGTPDAFFAWVPDESIARELVALFIAREFMLGMEN